MITLKESPIFTKYVDKYLSDDEYAALQWELLTNPEMGVLIPGSSGLRKIRWKTQHGGKRGGYRIIYYWHNQQGEIWLLMMYAKNEAENISAKVLRQIKEDFESE